MALQFFTPLPSADIHLSLGSAAHNSLALQLRGHDCITGSGAIPLPDPNVTFSESNFFTIDNVAANGILRAARAGEVFVRITYEDTVNALFHEVAVRVSVHDDIEEVWLGGNGVATVRDGSDDLVISVYARFSDGEVGDITGHGFMTFTSMAPGVASVDPASGRVTGNSTGLTTIRGTFNGASYDTQVEVEPGFGVHREVVERVWYNDFATNRKNILFLAEGFTAEEEGKFRRMVHRIAARMRRSKNHEPFRLLQEDYNIWMAFEASKEGGVSVGPLVDENTGKDAAVTATNRPQNHHKPLQVRASRLGLMYGRRLGDRTSSIYASRAQAPVGPPWYNRTDQLSFFQNDYRRSPSDLLAWKTNMFEYLGSLKTKYGTRDPNYDVGQQWALGGDDQGHVIVIVNDDHLGGFYPTLESNFGVMFLWGAISLNQRLKFNLINTPHSGIDHEPRGVNSLREATVAVAIHELTHSFVLYDEYEGTPGAFPGTPATVAGMEWFYNLTTRHSIEAGTPPLPLVIKWADMKRMAKSSALLRDATSSAASRIEVRLFPGEGAKWVAGPDHYYLRTPNCNFGSLFQLSPSPCDPLASSYQYYPERHRHEPREYVVTIVSVVGDVIELEEAPGSPHTISATTVIPARSTLFEAKTHDGDELGLVLPGVRDVLTGAEGVGGAPATGTLTPLLDKGGSCANGTDAIGRPPNGIADIVYPKKTETLIGLYEGAGRYNCDVFRPTGISKMRSEYEHTKVIKFVQHVQLCHLAKYVIVNQVNGSRHVELDLEYPGEPV